MGTVQAFAFTYAPSGWQQCRGQILPISQSTAMYALIGVMYGGDGRTTFGLPDLSGRTIVGGGHLRGGQDYVQGSVGGGENAVLLEENMPQHTHQLSGTASAAIASAPAGNLVLAQANGAQSSGDAVSVNIYGPASGSSPLAAGSIGLSGLSRPFSLMQPYMVMNYCIALKGNFPGRN